MGLRSSAPSFKNTTTPHWECKECKCWLTFHLPNPPDWLSWNVKIQTTVRVRLIWYECLQTRKRQRSRQTNKAKKKEQRSAPGELLPAVCPAASSGSGRSDLRLGPHFYGHVKQRLARVKMHEKYLSKGKHNSTPAERYKFQGIQSSLMTHCGQLLFDTNWCCWHVILKFNYCCCIF